LVLNFERVVEATSEQWAVNVAFDPTFDDRPTAAWTPPKREVQDREGDSREGEDDSEPVFVDPRNIDLYDIEEKDQPYDDQRDSATNTH